MQLMYGELLEEDRCRLVVGLEPRGDGAGRRMNSSIPWLLPEAYDVPPILRRSAHVAWQRRWMRRLAIFAANHSRLRWCRLIKTHGDNFSHHDTHHPTAQPPNHATPNPTPHPSPHPKKGGAGRPPEGKGRTATESRRGLTPDREGRR